MKKIIGIFLLLAVLSACGSQPAATATMDQGYPPPDFTQPTPDAYPGGELLTEIPPTQASALEPLPAEPQVIEFQTSDGQTLQGTYYPAAVNPAPLVVLMHWAGGDQTDWAEVAFWLQNRGLSGRMGATAPAWWDPSWFPPLNADESYAVFTFTFRGCKHGCKNFDRDLWLLDAQAAMEKARQLSGVDASRIAAVGASIGADGAADGCLWLSQNGGTCKGAFSFSPGDYLTIPYAQAVAELGALDPAVPAVCLYAANDPESSVACKAAQGTNYTAVEYPGNAHGMVLVGPGFQPDTMETLLGFLREALR